MEQTNNTTNEAAKRPTLLTVLCILSFIAAGISIIGLLIGMGAKGVAESQGINTDAALSGVEGGAEVAGAFSYPSMITSIILTIIGLVGVIMMWKLQKKGFFIYVAVSVLGLITPLFFGGSFGIVGAIITAIFVGLYAMNLKVMK